MGVNLNRERRTWVQELIQRSKEKRNLGRIQKKGEKGSWILGEEKRVEIVNEKSANLQISLRS